MKGFYFLLVTTIFLIMIQIQSGILQNSSATTTHATTTTTQPTTSTKSATSANSAASAKSATSATSATSARSLISSTTTIHTIKNIKGGAPALSGLGSGSVLIFLTNTLIQFLHFS
ncbi:CAMPATH-1 antigen-like [Pipistrellus kuhlii]|uniref:CAMPATH-1 antigen-like n=1 Tax=Pipistrellus kuhlii TaxID=59472 RepID=UPI00174F7392|nr:CAMPATH-1 antigen-like [Pipistrellus kuhlii]